MKKSITGILDYANSRDWPAGYPTQIIDSCEGYDLRMGSYSDRCVTLAWTPEGYKLPWIQEKERRVTKFQC